MSFNIGFIVSVAILMLSIVAFAAVQLMRRKKGWKFNAFNILFGGVFLASVAVFAPVYQADIAPESWIAGKALLMSLHNAFKMFALDGDYEVILENAANMQGAFEDFFTVYSLLLCIVAPIMTFGFVLSFFKNFVETMRFYLSYFRDIYVFSELNEKSITLASDIMENHPSARVIFTDVFETNEELSYELIERAKDKKAICFKKDILTIDFNFHSKNKQIYFFTIGEDEIENVNHSLKLISKYNNVPNSHLYIFSTGVEGELLLAGRGDGEMKVLRVNSARAVITHIIYDTGDKLLSNALLLPTGEKQLGAVICGLGKHGIEMVKALAWVCQIEGYRVRIDVYDKDPLAKDKFAAMCPELISEKFNKQNNPDDAQYHIDIHPGIDTDTKTFADMIAQRNDATYALVALGSDEKNIEAAVNLRMLFERNRTAHKPIIQAIVYNSDVKRGLGGVKNFKGQEYLIDFIGDIESSYSEALIIDSELEEAAYRIHESYSQWQDTPEAIQAEKKKFWTQEYCYRSSVADAVYAHVRSRLGLQRAGQKIEHLRWNAYTRSEGYIYSGSDDKSSRNDLGKMHHNLIGNSGLDAKTQELDDLVTAAHATGGYAETDTDTAE